eukprot:scaffold18552_cov18-Tisochrysis_lutea.AAC.1
MCTGRAGGGEGPVSQAVYLFCLKRLGLQIDVEFQEVLLECVCVGRNEGLICYATVNAATTKERAQGQSDRSHSFWCVSGRVPHHGCAWHVVCPGPTVPKPRLPGDLIVHSQLRATKLLVGSKGVAACSSWQSLGQGRQSCFVDVRPPAGMVHE